MGSQWCQPCIFILLFENRGDPQKPLESLYLEELKNALVSFITFCLDL